MQPIKILIPTDFSAQAEFAYLMVKKLEAKMPVDIHFLHMMDVPDTVTMNTGGQIETCGEIDVKHLVHQKEVAELKLAELKNTYGDKIGTHLALGKVTDGILRFSNDHQFDLIVMGTKGAWGIKEKLSGSETQMVARNSKIPVLSLMCDRSEMDIRNIVLVHNFDHPAKEQLEVIHKLIEIFDPKIHLLQITSGKAAVEKTAVESNMKTFAALNHITNYECHLINDADVEAGVVHFSQVNNIDMVCIGTQGKGGMFHHSAAEKLINHLFKPIISFHTHA